MRWIRIILPIAIPLIIALLAPRVARADDHAEIEALRNRVQQLEAREELSALVGRPTTRPVSQLGPIIKGDSLHVSIADLAGPGLLTVRDVRVDSDGKVGIVMVGPVSLVGLTLPDAARSIAKELQTKNLIRNAQVTVERWEAAATSNAPSGPLRTGDFVRIVLSDLRGPGLETVVNTQVDEQGNIDLPMVGAVKVGGLSEINAGAAINRTYRDANLISNAGATVLRTGAAEPL